MDSHETYKNLVCQNALEEINRFRDAFGLKPARVLKKGRIRRPTSCPIAATIKGRSSLRVHVGNDAYEIINLRSDGPPKMVGSCSATFQQFMELFDNGHLPELIKETEE